MRELRETRLPSGKGSGVMRPPLRLRGGASAPRAAHLAADALGSALESGAASAAAIPFAAAATALLLLLLLRRPAGARPGAARTPPPAPFATFLSTLATAALAALLLAFVQQTSGQTFGGVGGAACVLMGCAAAQASAFFATPATPTPADTENREKKTQPAASSLSSKRGLYLASAASALALSCALPLLSAAMVSRSMGMVREAAQSTTPFKPVPRRYGARAPPARAPAAASPPVASAPPVALCALGLISRALGAMGVGAARVDPSAPFLPLLAGAAASDTPAELALVLWFAAAAPLAAAVSSALIKGDDQAGEDTARSEGETSGEVDRPADHPADRPADRPPTRFEPATSSSAPSLRPVLTALFASLLSALLGVGSVALLVPSQRGWLLAAAHGAPPLLAALISVAGAGKSTAGALLPAVLVLALGAVGGTLGVAIGAAALLALAPPAVARELALAAVAAAACQRAGVASGVVRAIFGGGGRSGGRGLAGGGISSPISTASRWLAGPAIGALILLIQRLPYLATRVASAVDGAAHSGVGRLLLSLFGTVGAAAVGALPPAACVATVGVATLGGAAMEAVASHDRGDDTRSLGPTLTAELGKGGGERRANPLLPRDWSLFALLFAVATSCAGDCPGSRGGGVALAAFFPAALMLAGGALLLLPPLALLGVRCGLTFTLSPSPPPPYPPPNSTPGESSTNCR